MLLNYQGLSNSSGVYVIFNNTNWRVYIGSCKTFKTRWMDHIRSLRQGKHYNSFLQADFNKCGEEAFEFHVLVHLPGSTKEQRLVVEQQYLDTHFSTPLCYNGRKDAVSSEGSPRMGGWSEERRQKHIERNIGNKHGLGRIVSEETKRKISKALSGKAYGPHTEEWKQKMREGMIRSGRWTLASPILRVRSETPYKHTAAVRQKISAGHKGVPLSELHRLSLREAWKTRKPSSEETKLKIRQKLNTPEVRAKLLARTPGMLGKHHSAETKQKMREARLLWK